jgi:hypothetical protein
MAGLKCGACRRFVLRWPHIVVLVILAAASVLGLLELLFRII